MPRGIPRNQSTQRKILHRLKIARGHLNKVITMVEKDEYCIDVVHQSKALQAALKKVDEVLLENHLRTCLLHHSNHGNHNEMLDEIVGVIKNA